MASQAATMRWERLAWGSKVQMTGRSGPTSPRSRVSQHPSRSWYSAPSPALAPWGATSRPSSGPAPASCVNIHLDQRVAGVSRDPAGRRGGRVEQRHGVDAGIVQPLQEAADLVEPALK